MRIEGRVVKRSGAAPKPAMRFDLLTGQVKNVCNCNALRPVLPAIHDTNVAFLTKMSHGCSKQAECRLVIILKDKIILE